MGSASTVPYVVDKGFEGADNHRRWLRTLRSAAYLPAQTQRPGGVAQAFEALGSRIRQIVESAYDKLFNTFGLWWERPHKLSGLRARLAARVALHNFCIWLNGQLGRPRLAFADLLGW